MSDINMYGEYITYVGDLYILSLKWINIDSDSENLYSLKTTHSFEHLEYVKYIKLRVGNNNNI
jgi:hypothetical protein